MKINLQIIFCALFIVHNVFSQDQKNDSKVYFAYLIDTTYVYYNYSDALNKPFEIIIDESDFYNKNDYSFLDYYFSRLLEKYNQNNTDPNKLKAATIYNYNSDFETLTNIPFNKELYISSITGVYKGRIYGYYFQEEDGRIPNTAYTLINADNSFYIGKKIDDYTYDGHKYNERLLIVSDNKNITKIKTKEEDDLSLYKDIFKIISKYVDGLSYTYSEFFTPSKEIKVFKGHYTSNNELQYLVSCKYEPQEQIYTSGVFIMDRKGELIRYLFEFKNSSLITDEDKISCNYALGTIDIDGDGIDEIIAREETYDFGVNEIWKYDLRDFYLITTGFSGRNR